MRRITVKICVVALICFATFFAVTATAYAVFGWYEGAWTEGAGKVALVVCDIFAAALAAYLLYATFAQRAAVKRLLLYCDSESMTTADIKVVKKVIDGCARQADGVKVTKVSINTDDKQGFALTLRVSADGTDVQQNLDKLRCLLVAAFAETLGVKFNSVNFDVDKLTSRYTPTAPNAETYTESSTEEQPKPVDEECKQSNEN